MGFNPLDIVYFLIVLGIAVTIHEWGHFFIARCVGVRVLRFSIGFGPPLFKIQREHTEYCIAPIPLGGYVKMAGDNYEEELEGEPWEFLSAAPWRRIAIVLAGPVMNLVLAAFIFFLLFFLVGQNYKATREVGEIIPGSLADQAGMQAGDKITGINGQPVDRWDDVEQYLNQASGESGKVKIDYQRAGQVRQATIPVDLVQLNGESEMKTMQLPPVIAFIDQAGPAWDLPLDRGDEILSVSAEPVTYWHDVYQKISGMIRQGEEGEIEPVSFTMTWQKPDGEIISEKVTPLVVKIGGEYLPKVGIGPADYGFIPAVPPVIGKVQARSPAAKAGLKPGDRVMYIDGQPVLHALHVQDIIRRAYIIDEEGNPEGRPLEITWVTPEDETVTETVIPKTVQTQVATRIGMSSGRKTTFAQIGIQPQLDREKFGLIPSMVMGVGETIDWCGRFFHLFYQLVTREASGRLLGGPIAIFQGSASQARWGAEEFFRWIAILSANLAIINLFPMPILDGGHIVIYLIEAVRRKRLSKNTLEWAYRLSFFLFLLPLILMIFYVDMDRLGWFDPIKRLFE